MLFSFFVQKIKNPAVKYEQQQGLDIQPKTLAPIISQQQGAFAHASFGPSTNSKPNKNKPHKVIREKPYCQKQF